MKRRRSTWALLLAVLSVILAALSLVVAGLALTELKRVREELRERRVSARALERLWTEISRSGPPPDAQPDFVRWNGLCPKYGASSVEAFRRAVSEDPALRTRFAGFRWESARVEVLKEPRSVHVSYREGARIRWTRKTIPLVPGETLITDGKTTVRSYCCNEVGETQPPLPLFAAASVPPTPLETAEAPFPPEELTEAAAPPPPPASLDPPGSQAPLPGGEVAEAPIPPPPEESSAGPEPPPRTLLTKSTSGAGGGTAGGRTPVPEPGTAILSGSGLLALLLARRRRRAQTKTGEPT